MREGPLAELFRATEAAQKQAKGKGKPKDEGQQQLPTEPAAPADPPAPTPIRATPNLIASGGSIPRRAIAVHAMLINGASRMMNKALKNWV